MLFSIVTPSFRSAAWLKLCIASVADQAVEHEHIVQDSCSDDGTQEWLSQDKRVRAYIEKDQGMYDAINRGLQRAEGEVLAWLNCDEQYLPGALKAVAAVFERQPELDVLFGDVVMVNPAGEYLWHRKMQTPLLYHTWTCHLSTLSCAMFFRRRVVFDYGFSLNPKLRDVGDSEWMVKLLKAGLKMAALGQFTSAFTQTGVNMSAAANARRENRELFLSAPFWARQLKLWWILHHRVRRMLGGMYSQQQPFSYEVYTRTSLQRRQLYHAARPTFRPPAFKRRELT